MATRAQRSVYLDAVRAAALARVVLYHATGLWVLTGFTAMPLMFFIAGSLYAASIERRPNRQVVLDRYRRILLPYWLYVVALIALWAALGVLGEVNPLSWISFAMPVLSVNGPQGPPGWPVEMTWIALWYLQMHLILSLVGGWMRRMQLAHGRRYWIALVALVVLTIPIGMAALFFYALCWSLGYLQHDGVLEEWLRTRWWKIALATGPLGAAMFIGFHPDVALSGIGLLLLGAFWLTAVMGLRPRLEPMLDAHWVRATVGWFSGRSLTIYLWHMMAIWATVYFVLPGSTSPMGRAAWCVVLLPPITLVVGWAEDLAARKRPQLWPTGSVDLRQGATQSVPKMRSPASPKPGSM